MPRAPRVSLTVCEKLTYEQRAQLIGAYCTRASMHEFVACQNIGLSRDQRNVQILTTYGPALKFPFYFTLVSWGTLFCTRTSVPYKCPYLRTEELYTARFYNPYSPKRDTSYDCSIRTTCTLRSTVTSCSLVQTHPPPNASEAGEKQPTGSELPT